MIRVFPRRTHATPDDYAVYTTGPPLIPLAESCVHVSCTFTWDRERAHQLADDWAAQKYDVSIGGPAFDDPGGPFVAGRYLKPGYTMTSRGCNNRCWFCSVWKREGGIRELPIVPGWRLLDSNLLQCSDTHVSAVLSMLQEQMMPVGILGGLEAALLKPWHVEELCKLTISQAYLAYDTPDDYEPLVHASRMIFDAGRWTPQAHRWCCYVLIGYPGDTLDGAKGRIQQVHALGLMPFAMLYRDDRGNQDAAWIHFQSQHANPVKIYGTRRRGKTKTLSFMRE